MIAIVDYQKGNIKSVERGLASAGADVRVTPAADGIREADGIVLPGVGAFADAMATLEETGQADAIRDAVAAGVGRMPAQDVEGRAYKVPHVGWNTVHVTDAGAQGLFAGIPQDEYFYFTHSYVAPEGEATCGRTAHSVTFPSACARGRAFGVQFHPEKSSDAGAALLANFVRLTKER